jgi:RNA polymerase sigma-70 factor (ECF subfamily)
MEAVQVRPPDPRGDVAEGALVTTDFVDCYQWHYRRLIRALQLDGADPSTAEDVAQEAFARALARWRRVSRGPNPPGYVYTTAFRLLARIRRRSGEAPGGPAAAPAPASAAQVPLAAGAASSGSPTESEATTAVAVERALAVMPTRRRACAVMCLVVGLSVQEAAAALGIADGTVRKHLEEARRDLRAAVAPLA